jgi:DNA-binding protein H-NS
VPIKGFYYFHIFYQFAKVRIMSNLIDIQSQIETLQKQANEIKTREFAKTVQEIRAKMSAFGITVKDIQSGKGRGVKAKAKTALVAKKTGSQLPKKEKAASVVPAKYRGPTGESWSGRGLMPRWLVALVTQGQSKEEFLIKS